MALAPGTKGTTLRDGMILRAEVQHAINDGVVAARINTWPHEELRAETAPHYWIDEPLPVQEVGTRLPGTFVPDTARATAPAQAQPAQALPASPATVSNLPGAAPVATPTPTTPGPAGPRPSEVLAAVRELAGQLARVESKIEAHQTALLEILARFGSVLSAPTAAEGLARLQLEAAEFTEEMPPDLRTKVEALRKSLGIVAAPVKPTPAPYVPNLTPPPAGPTLADLPVNEPAETFMAEGDHEEDEPNGNVLGPSPH